MADGNQITHSTTGTIARDSQGRTRRDMTLPALGPMAVAGQPAPHITFVNDPVAGTRYILEADTKTARLLPTPPDRAEFTRPSAPTARAEREADQETVTTSLGTQTIGGVTAEGTRYTRTIPAGQIGNAKPIVIVTERWYSAGFADGGDDQAQRSALGRDRFSDDQHRADGTGGDVVPGAGGLHGIEEPDRAALRVRGHGCRAAASGRITGDLNFV